VTIPNITGAADTFVMNGVTATLTGKTLTAPVINTPTVAGMILSDGHENLTIAVTNQTDSGATATIPDIGDSADTFVMADTTQTLTGKTLTSPKINENVALTATATQLNSAGTKADALPRFYDLGICNLGTVDKIVTSVDMKNTTSYSIAASPDVPRALLVTITQQGGVDDTMGTLLVTGTDYANAVLTETITPTANSTTEGTKAFKTVTSIVGSNWISDTTADHIQVGTLDKLGLPFALSDASPTAIGFFDYIGESIDVFNIGTPPSISESLITMTSPLNTKSVMVLIVN
jgi:hypothetical protein